MPFLEVGVTLTKTAWQYCRLTVQISRDLIIFHCRRVKWYKFAKNFSRPIRSPNCLSLQCAISWKRPMDQYPAEFWLNTELLSNSVEWFIGFAIVNTLRRTTYSQRQKVYLLWRISMIIDIGQIIPSLTRHMVIDEINKRNTKRIKTCMLNERWRDHFGFRKLLNAIKDGAEQRQTVEHSTRQLNVPNNCTMNRNLLAALVGFCKKQKLNSVRELIYWTMSRSTSLILMGIRWFLIL